MPDNSSGGTTGTRSQNLSSFGSSLLSGVIAAALALVGFGWLSGSENGGPTSGAAATGAQAAESGLALRVARLEGLLELHPRQENESDISPTALLKRIKLLERELELHPPEGDASTE